jgi:hypothetical protein
MSNEVFNDVRKCDECESSFLLATESADYIEGKPNPVIHDEAYEGLFCYECISKLEKRYNYLYECISKLEKRHNYLDHYINDNGKVDDQLTLTSDGFASLTDDIEQLIEKYASQSAFGKCTEVRNEAVDLIHTIINKNN